MEDFNVFLIGGSGRSGTTILSKILSQHADIVDVPELRYLIDPDGIVDFYTSSDIWSPYHYNLRVERLEALLRDVEQSGIVEKIFAYGTYCLKKLPWKLKPRYCGVSVSSYCPDFCNNVDELISSLVNFSFEGEWSGTRGGKEKVIRYKSPGDQEMVAEIFRHFLKKTFNQIMQRQQATNYLEKNTWNHIWFDNILEILPESKLVHIDRDPRDVVSSYCHQPWMPSDPIQCAVILKDLLQRWAHVKKGVPVESYHEVSLEKLVSAPEKTLRGICDFYGVRWSEDLLKINLSKANSGRWEKHFSNDQKNNVQKILAPYIDRFENE